MIPMIKTKSIIQTIKVSGGQPKGSGTPVIVRAPKSIRCFRATIQVNTQGADNYLLISTAPVNDNEQCFALYPIAQIFTDTPPSTDRAENVPNTLVLDRRGVGYMDDELYFYSDQVIASIVWEGECYE